MAVACDLLEAELALDHLEAGLAAELPAHMRAFAAAHAAGTPLPPAPAATRRIATVQNALAHPLLADRALVLARLMIPIAIEEDRRVLVARGADRTWDGLAALTAARDAVARERFGRGFIDLMHHLHGASTRAVRIAWPAPVDGWHDPRVDELDWDALARCHGARGAMQLVRADVTARTFIVEPQREVIVVAPAVQTPAARFAVLHEFGHALAGLLAPAGIPRVVDEAAASYIARTDEDALATRARKRRLALAQALDAIERGLSQERPTEFPPWALWHDPGAQAAYVEAEAIADRWCAIRITLADAIAAERARIDAATSV
ncbi:MAG: hypothetical protein M4D80_04285 [Myxococcota bacterium]|nr:hypothetical protein [Deltaproteobacteria bacterium]MDQ3334357.1 hypothetical protein [Myxococcota bacterium]